MITYQQYTPHRIMRQKIVRIKNQLIREIMKIVTPHMWESGYVKREEGKAIWESKGTPLKLIAFIDPKTKKHDKYYKICEMKSITTYAGSYEGINGFTENDAVITDGYAGGLVTMPLKSMCIEDLYNLHYWVCNIYNWDKQKVKRHSWRTIEKNS